MILPTGLLKKLTTQVGFLFFKLMKITRHKMQKCAVSNKFTFWYSFRCILAFIENGKRLDDFHIKNLMGSAIVIDLSDKYGLNVKCRYCY